MIKKKPDWSKYFPPSFTLIEPKPPEEWISVKSREIISNNTFDVYSDYSLIALNIPDGIDFKDLKISFEIHNDEEVEVTIFTNKEYKEKNKFYEDQLRIHKEYKKKYEKKLSEFQEELIQYNLWAKQEKDKELVQKDKVLGKRLKAAENLLKKHGKL